MPKEMQGFGALRVEGAVELFVPALARSHHQSRHRCQPPQLERNGQGFCDMKFKRFGLEGVVECC